MLAQNLLVDEIVIDRVSLMGMVIPTLYEFSNPQWISPHSGREGKQIGPMTLLKSEGATDALIDTSIRSFGERRLRTEGTPANPVISFEDRWTVPFYTVYALVLPERFVANHISLDCPQDMGWCMPLQVGVSNERLFYHTIFAEHTNRQHIFAVEARIVKDERRYQELIDSSEVVEGTSEFKRLGWIIAEETKNPNFWFKLLEVGAKFIGKP